MSEIVLNIEHDGWTELVLNQPSTRNAITGPLGEALADGINDVNANPESKLMVLRGADGAFCSGLNLKEFNKEPPPDWLSRFNTIWRSVHKSLYESRKPVIVALEKYAINGGAALALAADLLIVGNDSFVQVGEVRQGMAAPYNLAWLNLRYSENVIAQLTMTGRRFSGEELHRLGIAYAAPPTAETVATATALADELAAFPGEALATIKGMMRSYQDESADQWFDKVSSTAPRRRAKIPRVN